MLEVVVHETACFGDPSPTGCATRLQQEGGRSLATWEQYIAEVFSLPEFGEWFARMMPLVESGRREFYNIEE